MYSKMGIFAIPVNHSMRVLTRFPHLAPFLTGVDALGLGWGSRESLLGCLPQRQFK